MEEIGVPIEMNGVKVAQVKWGLNKRFYGSHIRLKYSDTPRSYLSTVLKSRDYKKTSKANDLSVASLLAWTA